MQRSLLYYARTCILALLVPRAARTGALHLLERDLNMKRWLTVLALTCSLAAASACGDSQDAPGVTPTPSPPDVETILRLTGETMQNLSTFHVRLEHEGDGTTQFAPGVVLSEAEAEIINPDRMGASFKAQFGTLAVNSEFVAIGEDNWLTNPLSGAWEPIDADVSPLGFFNPRRGINAILAEVHSVEEPPDVSGTVYTLNGSVPAKALESLLGPSIEGAMVVARLVIDTDGYYLTEARVEGRVVPTDIEGIIRLLWLSRFNEPMTVEAPQ